MAFDECRDIRSREPRDAPVCSGASFSQELPNNGFMTDNGNACEPALLNQILLEVLFHLLQCTEGHRWPRSNRSDLAKHSKKPQQCGAITQEWASISRTKLLVSVHCPFIEVIKTEPLSREPVAEVTNNAKTAPGALPAMALLQQSRRIQIDMNTQRTFVQTLLHLGSGEIRTCGHVLSFAPMCSGKDSRLCRVNELQISDNKALRATLRHSPALGMNSAMPHAA